MSQQSNQPPEQTSSKASIRRHIILGVSLVALVAGGVGGWAATSEISGAVIASGSVVVDSNVKKIQHPSGGIVTKILVHNGDRVAAGDPVVLLDATLAKASLAIVTKRLAELKTREARLWAERDGASLMERPTGPMLETQTPAQRALLDHIFKAETRLFDLRRSARVGQKQQLRERIAQLHSEVAGLRAQTTAKADEIRLIQRELDGARGLWQKKLMSITRLTALEREATRLAGQHAQLLTAIAASRGRIAETELQIIQIDRDLGSEVATELRQIDAAVGELTERHITARDQLKRTTLRAPQSGIVHRSSVHTIGGVIGAGEAIMLIVPQTDALTVEARIAPKDIDQLQPGQSATLRFSAFNQRTTPEVNGQVTSIAADAARDETSGQSFYTVRISMSAEETARLGQVTLLPGMPVEAFIKTADRTVLSYLVKPLSDQSNRAFRED